MKRKAAIKREQSQARLDSAECEQARPKVKDEAKGYTCRPLPHDSKRWRMIAGNMMLQMVRVPQMEDMCKKGF